MGWRYHLFPPVKGWLNLAVVIDLYSRRIVGWALAGHLRAGLFTDALRQALHSRLPPAASSSTVAAAPAANTPAVNTGASRPAAASAKAVQRRVIPITIPGRNRSWVL